MRWPALRWWGALAAVTLLVTGCTSNGPGESSPEESPLAAVGTRVPDEAFDVVATDSAAGAALALSQRLFVRAETVVVAGDDPAALAAARRAATTLGVPLLMPAESLPTEIERLGAQDVLAFGDVGELPGATPVDSDEAAADRAVRDLERTRPVTRDVVVLAEPSAVGDAVEVTADNAGVTLIEAGSADPRADSAARGALAEQPEAPILALGSSFGEGLVYQAGAVRAGAEQPGGGLLAFPGRHVVALYGHPNTPTLGLLGEQGPQATIERAQQMASRYNGFSDDPVVPALEIITTVAAGSAGDDGDFSLETPIEDIEPLVDAAEEAGLYVVLDLQPGRSDFLEQAKRYRSLLARPHVGLALDPEWRLGRDQRPLQQIGSVSVEEVNRVGTWLADLTRSEMLPQKLFVLHQFRPQMIRDRDRLETGHPELATVVHVDGQGSQGAKRGTWDRIRSGAPEGVAWGWKNFIDEDAPMLTPEQTWAVRPRPDLITYQ